MQKQLLLYSSPSFHFGFHFGLSKRSGLYFSCRGPDDFNGYGYFYVRLYWTGFGLPANIVEEYILLSVLLHVFVGLKRTWDMKLALVNSQGINVLNLAISGLMLLTFMTIHLFQFRFGDTDQFGPYYIRPPPYLINFWGILSLNLFWTDASYVEPVGVRDIYVEALVVVEYCRAVETIGER